MASSGQEPIPSDAFVRLLATLEAGITKLQDGQKVVREEIRAQSGRVDALAGKIEVLASRLEELSLRVHRSNNLIVTLFEEKMALGDAIHTLDQALQFVETQQKARLAELARAHQALERAVEFIDQRLRVVRDAVADRATPDGT